MNTTSASPVDTATRQPRRRPGRILVWDAPVRVFHWLMVLQLRRRLPHRRERTLAPGARDARATRWLGLVGVPSSCGACSARGTRASRASCAGPPRSQRYIRGLVGGRPEHHAGHNPAGALAIVALLATGARGRRRRAGPPTTTWAATGSEELHEGAANVMLASSACTSPACCSGSWLHRDNLVGAMVTGARRGRPETACAARGAASASLMLVAVLGFWWMQWQSAPSGEPGRRRPAQRPSATIATTTDDGGPTPITIARCASCWPKTIRCSATACGPACASSASRSTGCATARPPSASCAPSRTRRPCSTSACR